MDKSVSGVVKQRRPFSVEARGRRQRPRDYSTILYKQPSTMIACLYTVLSILLLVELFNHGMFWLLGGVMQVCSNAGSAGLNCPSDFTNSIPNSSRHKLTELKDDNVALRNFNLAKTFLSKQARPRSTIKFLRHAYICMQ